MGPWNYLESGVCDAAFNMALDEALLEEMPRLGRAVLRFYGWTQPAASFGYFQKHAEVERLTPLRPLVRRPTAGGIVPHDADWTYSLAFPPQHEWYALRAVESYWRVHEWIRLAFEQLGVKTALAPTALKAAVGQCFVGYEQSDLLWRGRKIAGAAQRRTRQGLLIQGSVQPPPQVNRNDWHQAMLKTQAGAQWSALAEDQALGERVQFLVGQKYSQAAYNQKR